MNDEIDQNTNFANLSSAKRLFLGITIYFTIQKLKNKLLVCVSFLWGEVFWGNERKCFAHILGVSDGPTTLYFHIESQTSNCFPKWNQEHSFPCAAFTTNTLRPCFRFFFCSETKWLTQVTTFHAIARSAKHHTHC